MVVRLQLVSRLSASALKPSSTRRLENFNFLSLLCHRSYSQVISAWVREALNMNYYSPQLHFYFHLHMFKLISPWYTTVYCTKFRYFKGTLHVKISNCFCHKYSVLEKSSNSYLIIFDAYNCAILLIRRKKDTAVIILAGKVTNNLLWTSCHCWMLINEVP